MKLLIAIDEYATVQPIAEFIRNHKFESNTKVRIIHVVSPSVIDTPMASYPLFLESVSDETEKAAKLMLETLRQQLKPVFSQDIETNVLIGYPTRTIIDIAKDWQCDMIVVGCHGRKGFEKFLMGSVSEEIASQSPCSVIILHLPSTQVGEVNSADSAVASTT